MKFYTSIAELYDEIFPFQEVQKSFVESFLPPDELKGMGTGKTLLDVGCGTGSLALHLAESFDTVIGIDPDREMLERAKLKALNFKADRRTNLEELGTWVFLEKGMLDLEEEFAESSFDAVLCFGNTLVHLPDTKAVSAFLRQVHTTLKAGGFLMFQIINYDRIIDQKLAGLPTIDTEKIRFERDYVYEGDPEIIRFQTRLKLKQSDSLIENDIPLLALRPNQLLKLAQAIGFHHIGSYGNFKGEAFNTDSQPFIVVFQKP